MRFAIGRGGEYVDSYAMGHLQMKQLAPFVCPKCHEPVILKQGTKRRLHFAHRHSCGAIESVGHHQDKWAIRQWLQLNGYEVEQEVTVDARRADLFAQKDGRCIVVEVQASPLSIEQYEQRTADYAHAGFEVVWVASGIELSPVPSLRPWMRRELSRLHSLITIKNKAIYRFTGFPISVKYGQGSWTEVAKQPRSPFEAYYRFDHHHWEALVRRKRMLPPIATPAQRRLILKRLYPLGLLPTLLPTACYMPMTALWGVQIHPFDFQTVLYINRRECPDDSVAWSIEKTCRQFGVMPTSDFSTRFHVQWKQLLNVCHLSENVRHWPVPITLDEARRNDIRLFQGLQRFIAKSYIT